MFVKHVHSQRKWMETEKLDNQTWPRHYQDKPVSQITFQYVHTLQRKCMGTANKAT